MNELRAIKFFLQYNIRMIKILKAELKEYNTQLLNIKRKIKLTNKSLRGHLESYNKKLEYIQNIKGAENEKQIFKGVKDE
jgi:hypothetical protein